MNKKVYSITGDATYSFDGSKAIYLHAGNGDAEYYVINVNDVASIEKLEIQVELVNKCERNELQDSTQLITPVYKHDGDYGIIVEDDFVPLSEATEEQIDEAVPTYDDSYAGMANIGADIVQAEVVNIENNQSLVYEWVSKEYAEEDEYKRTFITITGNCHDWTSEARKAVDRLTDGKNVEEVKRGYLEAGGSEDDFDVLVEGKEAMA